MSDEVKLNIESARNPKYILESKDYISLEVQFKEFGDEWLPFTAYKHDVEVHGRVLWSMATDGLFGEVQEYVAPETDGADDLEE